MQINKINKSDGPIVAMESAVFSHLGLPLPQRKEALGKCKQAVEDAGATPLVTALLDGEIFVGLSPEQEEKILSAKSQPQKMSIRDISVAKAQKWEIGVTTVSATLAIASQAGIKVVATGGIGGVHQSDPKSPVADISADLTALGRYPVGVVCSGAKGFLDLPNTLEALETLGVPVLGYGTDTFPAFWCESSGLELTYKVNGVEMAKEVAQIVANLDQTGAVIAVPIPSSQGLDLAQIQTYIKDAVAQSIHQGAVGAKSTPFILEHIASATSGKSLEANLALLENNAKVAGQIATQL